MKYKPQAKSDPPLVFVSKIILDTAMSLPFSMRIHRDILNCKFNLILACYLKPSKGSKASYSSKILYMTYKAIQNMAPAYLYRLHISHYFPSYTLVILYSLACGLLYIIFSLALTGLSFLFLWFQHRSHHFLKQYPDTQEFHMLP